MKLHNNKFRAQKIRKKRKKISNRNKLRLYKDSHTFTRKNRWFHDHRKLSKVIDKNDKKIEQLKR